MPIYTYAAKYGVLQTQDMCFYLQFTDSDFFLFVIYKYVNNKNKQQQHHKQYKHM